MTVPLLNNALPRIATVTVLLTSDMLLPGDTTSARVEARDATQRLVPATSVAWRSSDETTASVSASGLVTALAPGSTDIIATASGIAGSARLQVTAVTTAPPATGLEPQLPRDSVDVSWRPATGRTIRVGPGDDLQRALASARRGDEVVLEAGAVFRGNFELPTKPGDAGDGWITVRTSASDQLPPLGQRIDPLLHGSLLATIMTPNDRPALNTEPATSGWRLVGIEFTVDSAFNRVQYGLVVFGTTGNAQSTVEAAPRDLILDRVYVHGHPNTNLQRCVALNSARSAVIGSQLLECHGRGFDSQAIVGWNGPGPFLIENNRLEAAGETIMFGGADPSIAGLVASDIIIRRNYLYRPMSWKGSWTIKNHFELKNAQRVLFESNILENNWVDGQIGFAVLLGSVNQNGRCDWCIVQDVTVRYNHVTNSAGGINVFERCGRTAPGGGYGCNQGGLPTKRVAIRHNLLTNIGEPGLGLNGRMYQLLGGVDDLTIENNTGFSPKIYVTFGDDITPMQRFVFRNNLGGDAEYPIHGSKGTGAKAITVYAAPGARFERNVIVARPPHGYLPTNNDYPVTRAAVGLNDGAAGISAWRLVSTSQYRMAGSGSSAPGVDIDELTRRLAGVADPNAPASRRR